MHFDNYICSLLFGSTVVDSSDRVPVRARCDPAWLKSSNCRGGRAADPTNMRTQRTMTKAQMTKTTMPIGMLLNAMRMHGMHVRAFHRFRRHHCAPAATTRFRRPRPARPCLQSYCRAGPCTATACDAHTLHCHQNQLWQHQHQNRQKQQQQWQHDRPSQPGSSSAMHSSEPTATRQPARAYRCCESSGRQNTVRQRRWRWAQSKKKLKTP